jgi:predicted dehydrogenase/threonine dehydrogenase-like Zn-dependent dehydrogenase
MKQIIQHLNNGLTELIDVPCPAIRSGHILIQTTRSLVSLGTERMLVEFGKGSLLAKAKAQPDKVKQVLEKIQTDGLLPTLEAVFNKLGQPLPLGYCNVGRVLAVGDGVTEFKIGDRVASNGPHAEMVCVPKNLCANVPEGVSDEAAAFTVIGSIGLQGIRLLQPTFGETVVVVGLGLIGLISAQLLRANGCRVIGFDFDQRKVDLANALGVTAVNPACGTDQVKFVLEQTEGIGTDAVLITASAKTNEIISQSARMCRKRGRIVLVGVIGLDISRADFYEKELSFQVSCSYGPGRYDDNYEQRGQDYPIGFVRWTEKRNFEAILVAIAAGQLDVETLITERVPLADFIQIYGDMGGAGGKIASLLVYDKEGETADLEKAESRKQKVEIDHQEPRTKNKEPKTHGNAIAIIGAGNFTSATVLPALKPLKANLKYIVSAGGLTASLLAKKAGATHASTDYQAVLADPEVGLVIITTRHNLHARMVIEALQAGKHVFVEKPLCLNASELSEIIQTKDRRLKTKDLSGAENHNQEPRTNNQEPRTSLTVGFNRRFAPMARKMKALLGEAPCNIVATMNAGEIPANVWVHDLKVGGGRIIGEACHFIDLCSYLTGSQVVAVCMNALGTAPQGNTDNASILLRYANGSNAVINYFANGSKAYAKERVEVHSQGRSLVLDNWRLLSGFGFKGFSKMKGKLDKGHKEQFKRLIEQTLAKNIPLIPFDSIVNTTRASFAAIESLKESRWVAVDG